jgi:BirA family biotin operon repressor/biotin-[acetyl-CoA-carboxylase] ligase
VPRTPESVKGRLFDTAHLCDAFELLRLIILYPKTKLMCAVAMQEEHFQFSRRDLDRIVAETFIEQIDYEPELESTNDRAMQLSGDPTLAARLLVLAARQTAGRGRGANRWWASEGALTFSVLLKAEAISLPPSRWPQLALTTGLALCDAIDELFGDSVAASLKWPNDVYLNDAKVCGILIETADGPNSRLVIGIGINVNNRAQSGPSELRGNAISLCEVTGGEIPLVEVLARVLQRLSSRLTWIGSGESDLREEWSRRCLLTGRRVQVDVGDRRVVGTCQGIDADGALLIDTEAGRERCLSGVVAHWN